MNKVLTNMNQSLSALEKQIARGNIGAEDASNKVTSIDKNSTDSQYPSAKCVFDALQNSGFITRGTWEDITNKVGTRVNSNINIKFNREFGLLQFSNWGSITNSAKTTVFTFNNDFTGGIWFSGNLVSVGFNSSNVRVPCMFCVRWGDFNDWGVDKNTIYVEESVKSCNVLQIMVCEKPDELSSYIDTH